MFSQSFSPKVLLVTGGAGFIGSHFVRFALAQGDAAQVINYDKLTYAGNLENLADVAGNPRYTFIQGDVCDGKNLVEICKHFGVDCIVHLAAESHVDRSIDGPAPFIQTNVAGTLSLLMAARECGDLRFLSVGTDEVFGSLGPDGFFTEQTPLAPRSPYSASKAAADHLVAAFGHTYGLPVLLTRCSNNYGPYQFPEKMIPLMINNCRQDKPLPVYGDGLHVRDWLHVEDHCRALWTVLTRGNIGESYNIGGGAERTNLEVVRSILRIMDKPERLITFVKDRPGHDRRYAIDATKIMTELDWKPSVQFEQGLEKTVDWYRRNWSWLDRVVSGAYQKYYEQMYAGR